MLEVKILNLKELEGYLDQPLKQFTIKIMSYIVSNFIANNNYNFLNFTDKK